MKKVDPTDREARLDRLCAEYLEAVEAGQAPERAAWLARYPDLAGSLGDFFGCLDEVEGRAATLRFVAGPNAATTIDHPPALSDTAMIFPSPPGYEIEREIGRGGMGKVYRAVQTSIHRTIAIKTLLAGAQADAAGLARFRTEALAAGRLQHPNIVQVYDLGEHNGISFITMEFVDGETLAEKIRDTPQSPEWSAQLVETLARAVDVAHRNEIVHRDLKPGNILLTRDGVPKIADFGLAKRLDSDVHQTQSGVIVGTLSYMAPEMAGGNAKGAGKPVDIYALGAILYELLTGRPPFQGETTQDLICQILQAEPKRPRELNPAVPRDLETICLKALAKDPRDRYSSALQLAEDLERFSAGRLPRYAKRPSLAGRTWRWVRRNRAVAGLSGLAAALIILVLGSLLPGPRDHSLAKVEKAGVLKIATDPNYPPMEFYRDGILDGFDIGLCSQLARHLHVRAEFIPIEWDWAQLVARLNAGEYDLIASTVTIDDERLQQVDFVEYLPNVALVFLCREGIEVRDVQDLNNKTVAVQKDTTAQKQVAAIRAKGINIKEVNVGVGTPATFESILAGKVDVALIDEPVAKYYAKLNPKLKITGLASHPMDPQKIGLVFRKGDVRLQNAVANGIQSMKRDGDWSKLLDQWFVR